jgi:hypothetical protein
MDIALVIAIALGLFLITTWVQDSQEVPVVEQILNIVRKSMVWLALDTAPYK